MHLPVRPKQNGRHHQVTLRFDSLAIENYDFFKILLFPKNTKNKNISRTIELHFLLHFTRMKLRINILM